MDSGTVQRPPDPDRVIGLEDAQLATEKLREDALELAKKIDALELPEAHRQTMAALTAIRDVELALEVEL